MAVTAETARKLKAQGHVIRVQSGAGVPASVTDEAYVAAGAEITDRAGALAQELAGAHEGVAVEEIVWECDAPTAAAADAAGEVAQGLDRGGLRGLVGVRDVGVEGDLAEALGGPEALQKLLGGDAGAAVGQVDGLRHRTPRGTGDGCG